MPTYFTFEGVLTADGVIPSELTPRPLPIFLEGFVHLLKLDAPENEKALLAERIQDSDLYDKKLHMYKVNSRYGRSPLENVSFIASLANPDSSLWGRGFVARASGSTAEFLQMWQIMFFGKAPFRMCDNKLTFVFEPFIPDYLIPENGEVKTTFLGNVAVTYHTGKLSALIPGETVPVRWTLTDHSGGRRTIDGESLPENEALAVRGGEVVQMDIEIGLKI